MRRSNRPVQTSVFVRARQSIALALVLGAAAMLLYPGGTPLDASTVRYAPLHNFLSDLGMTVAYNGQSNRLGAACFIGSVLTLVVGLGAALFGFLRLYAVTPLARAFTYATGVAGLLVCAAFVGVAFTPENVSMPLHVRFTLFGFELFPAAVALLALAAHTSHVASRRVVLVWAALAVVLACYAALLEWGPGPGIPSGLVTYVVAQKAITLVVVLLVGYQCARATGARLQMHAATA
jgi:hypothetical protein